MESDNPGDTDKQPVETDMNSNIIHRALLDHTYFKTNSQRIRKPACCTKQRKPAPCSNSTKPVNTEQFDTSHLDENNAPKDCSGSDTRSPSNEPCNAKTLKQDSAPASKIGEGARAETPGQDKSPKPAEGISILHAPKSPEEKSLAELQQLSQTNTQKLVQALNPQGLSQTDPQILVKPINKQGESAIHVSVSQLNCNFLHYPHAI